MLSINDFLHKQIIVYCPTQGDKISYRNDNLVIKDCEGGIKYQITCYRVFMLMIIGDCSLTTGIIRRAKKFGFSICFMTYSFRFYAKVNAGLEGNSYLHEKQYKYSGNEIGNILIYNKILNQRNLLNRIRSKSDYVKEGISILDRYLDELETEDILERDSLLGIEGNAAKVYFQRLYEPFQWKGRKPRIKYDYVNSLLDIGYTLLFNFIDAILQAYDFDTYKGVLHTCFYQRKSLVCDIMEPFRPIIDWRVRKGIKLGQFKKDDFKEVKAQSQLEYKKSSEYTSVFMEEILDHKQDIFLYIRAYYRAFMKEKSKDLFPVYDMVEDSIKYGVSVL